jgi:uncharacterized protein (TIGR02611 family)
MNSIAVPAGLSPPVDCPPQAGLRISSFANLLVEGYNRERTTIASVARGRLAQQAYVVTDLIPPQSAPEKPQVPLGYRETAYRVGKRILVFILGLSVVLIGIVMIVTPGPAVVVIPLGLGILASEFLWARKLLNQMKSRFIAGQRLLPDSRFTNWLKRWMPQESDRQ